MQYPPPLVYFGSYHNLNGSYHKIDGKVLDIFLKEVKGLFVDSGTPRQMSWTNTLVILPVLSFLY